MGFDTASKVSASEVQQEWLVLRSFPAFVQQSHWIHFQTASMCFLDSFVISQAQPSFIWCYATGRKTVTHY